MWTLLCCPASQEGGEGCRIKADILAGRCGPGQATSVPHCPALVLCALSLPFLQVLKVIQAGMTVVEGDLCLPMASGGP